MSESKNENYNPDDFFIPDISGVSYETQRLFFNVIRDQFSDINSKEDSLPKNIFRQNYQQILMDVVEMAAGGTVPAQDFLCYTYKKGVEGVVPSDLLRAHEWGIIAVSNGSKLSSERLRLFYDPLFEYCMSVSGALENILAKNGLDDSNVTDFVAQNYSILLMEQIKLDLLTVAKKPLWEEGNFVKFQYEVEQANKIIFPKLIKLIS
ncbi:MAG: hypothetical protein IKQ31_04100 [Clostridia bacterium]|nr:hypothetical protein [Clostridia bacterium]